MRKRKVMATTTRTRGKKEGWANPVAVELVQRGLRGTEPIIPPEYNGLDLPLTDLLAVFDYATWQFAQVMSPKPGEPYKPKRTGLG
jgi:hypothetical protein